MTLFQQAMAEVNRLPKDQQNAIAALILEELEDERRWDQSFASSQDQLSSLAAKARDGIRKGRVRKMGFDEL